MTKNLKLKDNELLFYAMTYAASQDGKTALDVSIRGLAEKLNVSTSTTKVVIDSLIFKKLIIKEKYIFNGVENCRYKIANLSKLQFQENAGQTSQILVTDFMIKNLKRNELFCFAWIYSFCKINFEKNQCFSAVSDIASFFNLKNETVYEVVERLSRKGYIFKNKVTYRNRNGKNVTRNNFSINKTRLSFASDNSETRKEQCKNCIYATNSTENVQQVVDKGEKMPAVDLTEKVATKFNEFLEHRKRLKKPLIPQFYEIFINKLKGFSIYDDEQIEILNRAMLGGFCDIVPLAKSSERHGRASFHNGAMEHRYSVEELEALYDNIDEIEI